MTNISDHIIIPKWLDDFLVRDLSAYFIRKNTDLVVLEWNEEDILGYLGTYFPRSYAESYRIFTLFFSVIYINKKIIL